MNLWNRISLRLRALFRKDKLDAEMAEEMRAHLERRAESNRAAGLAPDDARYSAQRQFGHLDTMQETARDQRGWVWLEQLTQDVRFAFRSLRKSPGFTGIALLTLALGIGVNTSMFSVLNTLLFHTPPYAEPDSIVEIFRTGRTNRTAPTAPANFLDLAAQTRSVVHMTAIAPTNYNLADAGQSPEQLQGQNVTGDFFDALGVKPALGRGFGPEEDQPGRNGVVVLSDTFWRQHFAADPAVIGRSIRLDGEPVTVIGVMPAGFDDRLVWGQVAAWRPMAFSDEDRKDRYGNRLWVIARLKPGVTRGQAQSELDTISASLAAAYPASNAQAGVNLVPLARANENSTTRMLSWFAMGLATCVLLIACTNLANLQFARNAARSHEHAIRGALGASRFRLIRQSLTESLLLSSAGGTLGLLVAAWCNSALGTRLGIAGQTGVALAINQRVMGFALAATILTGLGFGILPALLASRTEVNDALKQGARGTTSGAQHRIHNGLIVAEIALALVLLSAAGFFLRGLDQMVNQDHGWRTDRLLTASVSLSVTKYHDKASMDAFYDRLESRLAALPGVERVSLSRSLPFSDYTWGLRMVVEGRPLPKPGSELMHAVNAVSPGYFDTLGLTVVAGRTFTTSDMNGPPRTIINELMAQQLWPGESAIGKRIAHPVTKEWQEIIGVVRDVKFPTQMTTPTPFQSYLLLASNPDTAVAIALGCSVPPEALAEGLRKAVAEIDPDLSVQRIRPAELVVEQGLSNFTILGWLLMGFALLGLLLAAVGIYGVIAGFVVQRTNEIGIRLALGAQLRDILRLVLGQGLRLALIGTAVGLAGTYAVARLLASIMPALPGAEAGTALGVTLVLVAVALLACWLPARRAAKVDPMIALRNE